MLLVNPRVPLPTGPVFKGWDGVDRGPMPTGNVSEIAFGGRNDLEAPAIAICPVIAESLALLTRSEARLVRMSGSGATCFALYGNDAELLAAAELVARERPDWWQLSGHLR